MITKTGYVLTLTVLFGLILYFWGIVFNQTALLLNDNKMPVVVQGDRKISSDREIHKIADETVVGYFLIDWIPVRFTEIKKPENLILNNVYHVYERYLNYPVEGGLNMVSVGDLMIWIGSTLFLLFLVPLILIIPFVYKEKL